MSFADDSPLLSGRSQPGPAVVVPAPPGRYVPQSLADMKAAQPDRPDWLWQGFLAPGNVTLLTSLWKSGKSTLIAVLLARMKTGGTVAGLPVRAGRAVVISEEAPAMWLDRSRLLDLDGHVDWYCQPFRGKPTDDAWHTLLGQVGSLHDQKGVDLLVIDSLANLSPMRSENDAVQMLDALKPWQALTARGICLLITHHPKKGPTVPGQAARGSGALSGYVDILLEMHALCRKPTDRRRRLRAFSRHPATPPSLVLAWTADGTDYVNLGSSLELDFEQGWPVLQEILAQAEGPLSRRTLWRRWPDSAVAPARHTLWKWLSRAVQDGRLEQQGQGHRKDPFLYSLPGMVEKWQQDFLDSLMNRLARDAKQQQPPPPS
jgi:hypothetical protein